MTPTDRQPLPPDVEAAITKITESLFTNGFDERADRLVLRADGEPLRYLGAWGRPAIADKLREAYALGLAAGAQGEREALAGIFDRSDAEWRAEDVRNRILARASEGSR